jgi:uncharacterized protein (DUF2147 family)
MKLLPVAFAVAAAAFAVPANASPDVLGLWKNPKGTAYVRTEMCGDRLCGTIACATAEGLAKARAKGVDKLVGVQVIERLSRRSDSRWRGRLFVPDLGGRFEAALTPLPPDRIAVKGCVIAGVLCKTQIWTRVPANACESVR